MIQSSAVMGLPSDHFIPRRILKVISSLLGLMVQDSAM